MINPIYFTINGKPKPKPAGCLKYSHGRAYLSMDKNGYLSYCENVVDQLCLQYPLNSVLSPYGISYTIIVPNIKGLGDLTNIMEGLQDCLVKAGIIKDDSPTIIKRVATSLLVKGNVYQSVIILSFDRQSFLNSID